MKWRVLYGDWGEYNSDEHKWEDIPNDNVQKVFIIFPNGSEMIQSGVDKYIVQKVDDGLRLTYWKDENPEEKDPYYMKGRSRIFWNDNTSSDDTGYINVKDLRKGIPDNYIKRGKYLDEKTAKAMRIL